MREIRMKGPILRRDALLSAIPGPLRCDTLIVQVGADRQAYAMQDLFGTRLLTIAIANAIAADYD